MSSIQEQINEINTKIDAILKRLSSLEFSRLTHPSQIIGPGRAPVYGPIEFPTNSVTEFTFPPLGVPKKEDQEIINKLREAKKKKADE